jgi:hypothetical protein
MPKKCDTLARRANQVCSGNSVKSVLCHSGAMRSIEPGIHFAASRVAQWIPGLRLRRIPE